MAKYIDADALMNQRPENLNDRCENYDKAVYASGWNDCNECWCDLIDEMPDADVEPVERWISVDEKLPGNDKDVIAYSDDGEETRIVPANFVNGVWYDCLFNKICLTITHWMNLPEPPKMDGGSE